MATTRTELKGTGYEIFIGTLSVLSIVNIFLMYLVQDDAMDAVLGLMNGLLSLVFLVDFVYRFATAPRRSTYFFRQYGWADLLASLPLAELKILRIFRLVRVYRLLVGLGPRRLGRALVRDRAGSALFALLIMGVLVLQFGSLVILAVERNDPDANIVTAPDAIWYTLVTISTVGYGDQYPVTEVGRLLGGIIIVVGVAIFGTFTGYLANIFLSPKKGDAADATDDALAEPAPDAAAPEDRDAAATLADIRALLRRTEADLETIKRLLDGSGTGEEPTPAGDRTP